MPLAGDLPSRDAPLGDRIHCGALDAGRGNRPQERQYIASAAAWEPIPDDGLVRHAGCARD
jgi:hypothetical protein